jgi:hypothetical protein
VRTKIDSEGNMKTIGERRALPGSINLVTLKTEILSALSSVGSATTTEELQQAEGAALSRAVVVNCGQLRGCRLPHKLFRECSACR